MKNYEVITNQEKNQLIRFQIPTLSDSLNNPIIKFIGDALPYNIEIVGKKPVNKHHKRWLRWLERQYETI